jgi:hypothetical protein
LFYDLQSANPMASNSSHFTRCCPCRDRADVYTKTYRGTWHRHGYQLILRHPALTWVPGRIKKLTIRQKAYTSSGLKQ